MSTEIPMDEAELMALMEELEMETGVARAEPPAPKPASPAEEAPAAPVEPEPAAPTNDDETAELLAELEGLDGDVPMELEDVTIPAASPSEVEELEAMIAELPATVEPQPEPHRVEPKEPAVVPAAKEEAGVPASPHVESDLSAYTANLKYYVDANEFKLSTRISDVQLDQCLIEQNSLRAFYGSQAALAEAQHARCKARFDVLEARLYDEMRRMFAEAGEKPTEKMVENAVKMDPRWLSEKNRVIEAETIANVNRALVMSLVDRRDMLIQLGADRRDEMKGQARIMAASQERLSESERAVQAAKAALNKS